MSLLDVLHNALGGGEIKRKPQTRAQRAPQLQARMSQNSPALRYHPNVRESYMQKRIQPQVQPRQVAYGSELEGTHIENPQQQTYQNPQMSFGQQVQGIGSYQLPLQASLRQQLQAKLSYLNLQ